MVIELKFINDVTNNTDLGNMQKDIYEKIVKVKSASDHLDMLVQESQT